MAARLFDTIGWADMNDDPRFNTNEARMQHRPIVDSVVADWIAARTRDDVMAVFVEAGVTIAPLYSIADICHDPHFIDREIYSNIPDDDLGTIPVHKPVPTLSDTPATLRMAAPKLGQHSWDILQSAGFDTDSITGFLNRKQHQIVINFMIEQVKPMTHDQTARVWRSLLYMPLTIPNFWPRQDRGADALILDLEDSIAPHNKAAARSTCREAIANLAPGPADILVRINAPLRHAIRDLEAVVQPGLNALFLPKTESAGMLLRSTR